MITVIFDKAQLTDAVQQALCAVSERNTVTAMEGILFECEGTDKCVLCSYDMEKGVRQEIDAQIVAGGDFIVNANKLFRIIRTLPGPNITLEIDEKNVCKISSGTSSFQMNSLPGRDFPHMPVLRGNNTFRLKTELLKKLINEVQFAIAVNDQRAVLNGAFFEVKEGELKIVASDANVMAVRECACEHTALTTESGIPDLRFIIPGKTLAELIKLMTDTEEVEIATTRRHIIFFLEDKIFFSRLIDSEYINYNKIIRTENKITVYASRAALLGAAERASLVTEERTLGQAKSSLKCSFEDQILHIFADNLNGRVDDTIEIEKEGEDLLIGFNCRNFMNALRACPEDSLKLSLSGSLMSMQIEGANPAGDDRFLYIVSPVKLR